MILDAKQYASVGWKMVALQITCSVLFLGFALNFVSKLETLLFAFGSGVFVAIAYYEAKEHKENLRTQRAIQKVSQSFELRHGTTNNE